MAPSGEVHLDLALAAVVSGGGILGYVRKSSLPSVGVHGNAQKCMTTPE
jgi:hypothetical protein